MEQPEKLKCIEPVAKDERWSNETPYYAASHLGLHCLPMSHLLDSRLKV